MTESTPSPSYQQEASSALDNQGVPPAVMPRDSRLHQLVENKAREAGADGTIQTTVTDRDGGANLNASAATSHSPTAKYDHTVEVSTAVLEQGSRVTEGFVEHEVGHLKERRGGFGGFIDSIVDRVTEFLSTDARHVGELKADANISPENATAFANSLAQDDPKNYSTPGKDHPSTRNRVDALTHRVAIHDITGLNPGAEELNIKPDGSLDIKGIQNPDARLRMAGDLALKELGQTGKKFSANDYTKAVDRNMNTLNNLAKEDSPLHGQINDRHQTLKEQVESALPSTSIRHDAEQPDHAPEAPQADLPHNATQALRTQAR